MVTLAYIHSYIWLEMLLAVQGPWQKKDYCWVDSADDTCAISISVMIEAQEEICCD